MVRRRGAQVGGLMLEHASGLMLEHASGLMLEHASGLMLEHASDMLGNAGWCRARCKHQPTADDGMCGACDRSVMCHQLMQCYLCCHIS
jgi:hypothetical protein